MNGISKLRKELGMTQQQLAVKLGISVNAMSLYERNKFKPSYEKAKKMSRLFGFKKVEDFYNYLEKERSE